MWIGGRTPKSNPGFPAHHVAVGKRMNISEITDCNLSGNSTYCLKMYLLVKLYRNVLNSCVSNKL